VNWLTQNSSAHCTALHNGSEYHDVFPSPHRSSHEMIQSPLALPRLKKLVGQIQADSSTESNAAYAAAMAITGQLLARLDDFHPAVGKLNEFVTRLNALFGVEISTDATVQRNRAIEALELLSEAWMLGASK
jgi:hypothetical protein